MADAVAQGGRRARRRGAPRAHARRRPAGRGGDRARRGPRRAARRAAAASAARWRRCWPGPRPTSPPRSRARGPAAVEWKLDGVRVQVHRDGDDVAVFTRTLDDVTARVPEVVAAALALPAGRRVLDGEVIALRAGRPPAAVPGHGRAVRRQARRRPAPARDPALLLRLRRPAPRRRGPARRAARRAGRGARRGSCPRSSASPRVVAGDADEAAGGARGGARRRPRGRDGQGARRALRRRPARRAPG